ncbi:MAG: DUF805 domain-containing protein [Bacteroidetes bacterium]|nr:DUF805 domain-containing protein [Bacteroidota bacterium]
MKWYLAALKNYAGFSGRARQREYWMFILFYVIFAIVAVILDNVLGIATESTIFDDEVIKHGPVSSLYNVAMIIPGWAVTVRRLHDVGKSGWTVFIVLIPIIGVIWFLIYMIIDSDPEENKYGAKPHRRRRRI